MMRRTRTQNTASSVRWATTAFVAAGVLCTIYLALLSGLQHAKKEVARPSRWLQQQETMAPKPCPDCPDCSQIQPIVTAHQMNNPRKFHIITTAAGSSNHWQARVHHYWYKKQKEACEKLPVCDMGGFTRLLHTGKADDLMDEIPTLVVDPLPPSAFGGQDTSYIVLNRPYAFLEWLDHASIPEKYILMCEADHLMMHPIPNIMQGENMAAALFSYMNPVDFPEVVRGLLGDLTKEQIASIPHIGNSPTFVSVKDFRKLAPAWYNMTMQIWRNEAAHKAWNWVLEMYGFALATYHTGLHQGLLHSYNLLAHPPFDKRQVAANNNQPYYLLHLTYPMRYNSSGVMVGDSKQAVWEFEKRKYSEKPPPRALSMPPSNVDNDLVRLVISMINEATRNIPCWDIYHDTLKVTSDCPEANTANSASGNTIATQ